MAEATEKKDDKIAGFTFTPGFGEGTEFNDGFSGAGMLDTVMGLRKSIMDGNQAAMAAYGVGLGFDVVGAVLNPLGALLAAGVGWLIDHLYFLREPLDLLMGDNIAVRQEAEKIREDADAYADVATAHVDALKKLENWTGATADAFRKSMKQVSDELSAIGHGMNGLAEIMATMGACVTAFRSLVRDIIAMVIGNLIGGAIVAAGLAPFTFGASIVAFVGVALATALEAIGRCLRHIANLKSLFTSNKAAAGELTKALGKIGDDAARFGKGGGAPKPTGGPPVNLPGSKPPDVPGVAGGVKPSDSTVAAGGAASKPPDVPGAAAGAKPPGTHPNLWTKQDIHDFGVKIKDGRKAGMEQFGKFGKGKLEAKLTGPPHNKTSQEAAGIAQWVKNFEELAAPGGHVVIAGKSVPTGSVLHLLHEIWKEMAPDEKARLDNRDYLGDLDESRRKP